MEEPHAALPPPESVATGSIEVAPVAEQQAENTMALRSSEQASKAVEMPTISPPSTSGQAITQPTHAPALPPDQNVLVVPMSSAALAADDADLIEKEWVERAKTIIAHTSHDPRQQNQEINKIKADYIRKRYNKDIKIQEG